MGIKPEADELGAKVFLYLRTSTDQQDDSPLIPEERARTFCATKGWTVVETYYDIVTGQAGIDARPQFKRMLVDAKLHGVRGFVGLTFNRFLRSTRVKAEMEAALMAEQLFIWGIDDNMRMGLLPGARPQRAGEKAMVNMTVTMDQYYSDFISDKIRDHHEHRVSNALHHSGPPPFGYRKGQDVHLINGRWYDGWVPDDSPDGSPEGMAVADRLRWIFQRFLQTENLTSIACELSALGVPPPRRLQWNRLSESEKARRLDVQAKNRAAGHKVMSLPPTPHWDSSVLSDMLRSKTYLGMIAYTPNHSKAGRAKQGTTWHPGRHEALLNTETFERVARVLDARHQATRRPATQRTEALLAGMFRCTCGMALTFGAKGPGTSQFRYHCNLKKRTRSQACQTSSLNSNLIDPIVLKLLLRGLRARLNEIRAAAPLLAGPAGQDELALERDHLKKKRIRVLENYEEGLYGEGPAAKAERDAKLSPILKRLHELEGLLEADTTAKADELGLALSNVETLWDGFPMFVKRDILRTYVPDGFHLTEARKLRAVVCGITLEVAIPRNAPTTTGVRYGGRQRKDGQPASGELTVGLTFPSHRVSGGKSLSGGSGTHDPLTSARLRRIRWPGLRHQAHDGIGEEAGDQPTHRQEQAEAEEVHAAYADERRARCHAEAAPDRQAGAREQALGEGVELPVGGDNLAGTSIERDGVVELHAAQGQAAAGGDVVGVPDLEDHVIRAVGLEALASRNHAIGGQRAHVGVGEGAALDGEI
ncbi:MAG: recombinase family protein [Candidatus Sericytochromatia bacterium]|nr:recombinase family protein [Candidatus Sericytochromatia bacterium]